MAVIIHRFDATPGDCNPTTGGGADLAWLIEILDPYSCPFWHCFVEVVENYMPPFPRPETKPTIQVRWGDSYLRHGRGTNHPFFWDIYGHEFRNVQQAWLALSRAPAPPLLTYANRGKPSDPDEHGTRP